MVAFIEHELAERLVRQAPPENPFERPAVAPGAAFSHQARAAIRPDERGAHFILSSSPPTGP